MQNLPNIMPAEVTIVCAAFVLLCIAPAVLAWSDRRRRRRLERQAAAAAAMVAAPISAVEPLSAWNAPAEIGSLAEIEPTAKEPLVQHFDSVTPVDYPADEHHEPALVETPPAIVPVIPEPLQV